MTYCECLISVHFDDELPLPLPEPRVVLRYVDVVAGQDDLDEGAVKHPDHPELCGSLGVLGAVQVLVQVGHDDVVCSQHVCRQCYERVSGQVVNAGSLDGDISSSRDQNTWNNEMNDIAVAVAIADWNF